MWFEEDRSNIKFTVEVGSSKKVINGGTPKIITKFTAYLAIGVRYRSENLATIFSPDFIWTLLE